jgi:hypothetical protein
MEKKTLSTAYRIFGALAAVCCLLAVNASADETPMIPVGLDAYRMWERWPYQRIGARAYMRSTYDRSLQRQMTPDNAIRPKEVEKSS